MDFTHAETTLRDVVVPVVEELQRAGADIADLMLLGAVCRDVLHQAVGHRSTLRRTGDLDLAIAVSSWEPYDAITSELTRVRNGTNIRYLIAGTAVDLVPFGEVENPDGQVPRQRPEEPMNVMGFRDVWRDATGVPLPGVGTIRVPTIAGFTLLKLSAWASRSSTGDYKDAGDLACAMFWYQQLDEVEHRLFQYERGSQLLERTQFDTDVASVMLLIDDALSVLEEQRRSALRNLWNPTGDHEDLLATYLVNDRLPGWPTDPRRLLEYADAVRTTLLTTSGAVA